MKTYPQEKAAAFRSREMRIRFWIYMVLLVAVAITAIGG